MKQTRLFLLAAVLLSAINSWAQSFYFNGLSYNITSNEDKTVEVARNSFFGDLSIPSNVTYNNVTYSVTSICKDAFYNCSVLTSVNIPNSVTSIGEWAFSHCSGLTSVNIPNSVIEIGEHAFEYCTVLKYVTIPNSVTSIGEWAFGWCTGLTSVTIPKSVTYIGVGAFASCTSLPVTSGIRYAGNYLVEVIDKKCKSVYIKDGTRWIGSNAFSSCTNLNSVTIPNSVEYICTNAFYYCTGLTSIILPNSVRFIGLDAFYWCSNLKSVTLSNNLEFIDFGAFYDCTALTSVIIPNSVTSINYSAFQGCSSLTSISVEKENTKYDSRNDCNAIIETATNTLVLGIANTIIPNSVTSIGEHAFSHCSGLTSLDIPNSVTSIGEYAFNGCIYLTTITIRNNVSSIGANAFRDCLNLTSITIPSSVKSIGENAFAYCRNLNSVTNLALEPQPITADCFSYYGTLHVLKGCKKFYSEADNWCGFRIVEDAVDLTPKPLCSAPTIDLVNGKIVFGCETEGAEVTYEYTCTSSTRTGSGTANEFTLQPAQYTLTVKAYAMAEGYATSRDVTRTFTLSQNSINGDMNGDGKVDIQDANIIVNRYLGE